MSTRPSRPSPRRRSAVLAALVAAAFLPATAAYADTSGAAAAVTQRYVALGDSFTAGPLIPGEIDGPLTCLRSSNNYPNELADAVPFAEFEDVSCSGATTEHMTRAQGLNAPQFDALTDDTSLVTMTIGGNDAGFVDILLECAALSLSDPHGNPCERHYTAGGGDELAERIPGVADEVESVLAGIAERSPQATVALVGYLDLLPERGGCWPVVPIADGDVAYLHGFQDALNAALAERAEAAGAEFVSVSEPGHDMCRPHADRWVEGILVTNPAAPVHPNARGMTVVAERIAAALDLPAAADARL
ncbi:SGNH/GDSL hydrolase family protein [Allonocardiopsis opalescens]|uniref:GDSL-like lipase/acylhydrolase family protein n=1 Tax=Allonocardiopsis opalescens TaxID=1144618 RepID=A0A2T0Q7S0_9ACTN|nr:SGNH/GDSL hydrolase family protein [Allonocardiopsis opalescens]PRX99864.1 GDSL-like lipase/acylhydrolase family protein [Allonocardiopsis opalescens]